MHARVIARAQISVNGATGMRTGPVNVELAGFAKSTWNWKMFRSLESAISTKKLGWPAGGSTLPSRSEGNRLATLGGFWKHILPAELPASMAARSKAHACAPKKRNVPPKWANVLAV